MSFQDIALEKLRFSIVLAADPRHQAATGICWLGAQRLEAESFAVVQAATVIGVHLALATLTFVVVTFAFAFVAFAVRLAFALPLSIGRCPGLSIRHSPTFIGS